MTSTRQRKNSPSMIIPSFSSTLPCPASINSFGTRSPNTTLTPYLSSSLRSLSEYFVGVGSRRSRWEDWMMVTLLEGYREMISLNLKVQESAWGSSGREGGQRGREERRVAKLTPAYSIEQAPPPTKTMFWNPLILI